MEELVCAVLNNGVRIPAIGYAATFESSSDDIALRAALDCGFRFLDTDTGSGHEGQLGEVLQDYTKRHLPREDLFISTRIRAEETNTSDYKQLLTGRLKQWRLSEADLLSLGGTIHSQNDTTSEHKEKEFLEAWKTCEDLANQGLARSIGLANASLAEIKAVTENCDVTPAVVQVHQTDLCRDNHLVQYCRQNDIHLVVHLDAEGNSPGGSLQDNHTMSFGKKSTNQVLGRFYLENNVSVVIHEKDPSRIKQAFRMLDFSVTSEELSILQSRRLLPAGI